MIIALLFVMFFVEPVDDLSSVLIFPRRSPLTRRLSLIALDALLLPLSVG